MRKNFGDLAAIVDSLSDNPLSSSLFLLRKRRGESQAPSEVLGCASRARLMDHGQRGVIRRRFGQRDAEKLPQRVTLAASPGDAAPARESFEVADQQRPEADSGLA